MLVVSTLTASGKPGRAAGTAVWRDGEWDLSAEGREPTAVPGPVAGSGDTAVVVRTVRDGRRRGVAGIRVTHDAGRTWREVPTRGLPSGSLTGVAVTGDGTTLLTDSEGVLTAVTRDGTGLLTDKDGVVYRGHPGTAPRWCFPTPRSSPSCRRSATGSGGSPGTAAADRCGGPTTRAPPGTGRRCRGCTDAAGSVPIGRDR